MKNAIALELELAALTDGTSMIRNVKTETEAVVPNPVVAELCAKLEALKRLLSANGETAKAYLTQIAQIRDSVVRQSTRGDFFRNVRLVGELRTLLDELWADKWAKDVPPLSKLVLPGMIGAVQTAFEKLTEANTSETASQPLGLAHVRHATPT